MTTPDLLLSFPNVLDQPQVHASCNAAYSEISGTGVEDAALELFDVMLTDWKAQPPDESFRNHLELLSIKALARSTVERCAAHPEFSGPGLDAVEQRKRLNTLLAARSRSPSRINREIQGHADAAAEEAGAKVDRSLQHRYATSPFGIRPTVEEAKRVLQDAAAARVPQEPFISFQRCLQAATELEDRKSMFDAAAHEFVMGQLRSRGQRCFEHCLGALAVDLANQAYQRALPRLLGRLEQFAAHGTEAESKVLRIREELEGRRSRAAEEGQVSRGSIVVKLPGPDRSQVLAAVAAHLKCGTVLEAAAKLRELLEPRLRLIASIRCPHLDAATAPLAELIRVVEPADVAVAFASLVREATGAVQSVYELHERFGLERIARFLFGRAEPTVHLDGFGVEQFGVSMSMPCIVRLPAPSGPKDHFILAKLRQALQRAGGGGCDFTVGDASERGVTVVRMWVRFPVGILAENRALFRRYVSAAAQGHRPHLLGILPDSCGGHICDRAKRIAESHRNWKTQTQ